MNKVQGIFRPKKVAKKAEKVAKVVVEPAVDEQFSKVVKTQEAEKLVIAGNQAELDEAVEAVKAEKPFVQPDINDVKDANKTLAELNK